MRNEHISIVPMAFFISKISSPLIKVKITKLPNSKNGHRFFQKMLSRKAKKSLRHRGIKIKSLPNARRLSRRKERLDFDIHPKLFGLWAKEVVLDYTPNGITKKAIEALQVSTERFISLLFKDAKLCAYH